MKGVGLHFVNAQWRPYTNREIAGALDLAPDNLLFLAYPGDSSQPDRIAQESDLCRAMGITPPVVRVYRPSVYGMRPHDAVYEDKLLLGLYRAIGIHPGGWIPWNEPNIEGFGEDWSTLTAWEWAYAEKWQDARLNVPLHLPALAPIGDYRDGYIERADAGLGSHFQIIDCHIYSSEHVQDIYSLHGLFPEHPIAVTEYNFANWH